MSNNDLLDALGIDMSGEDEGEYFDFNTLQRSLNSLKPVTNESARMLLSQGRIALDKAITLAGKGLSTTKPGEASDILARSVSRDVNDIRGHLHWHEEHIGKDPNAIYDSGEDLKKYYLLSFRTYNSALQGVQTAESQSYYQEVIRTIADYISRGRKAMEKASNKLAWGLGIVGIAAVGYGYYKLKMAKLKYGSRQHELED